MAPARGFMCVVQRTIGASLFMTILLTAMLGWQQWMTVTGALGNDPYSNDGAATSADGESFDAALSHHSPTSSTKGTQMKPRATNPHIVPLPASLTESIASAVGTERKQAVNRLVDHMREVCERNVFDPLGDEAASRWGTRGSIPTQYNNQSYWFEPGLVCFDERTRWFYDPTTSHRPAYRTFQSSCNLGAYELKPTAVLYDMMDDADKKHLPQALQVSLNTSRSSNDAFTSGVAKAAAQGKFYFHRSLGVLSVGNWGTASIYHFLMDLVMGMVSLVLSNPEIRTVPRDTIQMHENHLVKIEKWNLPPCFECLSVSSIVTDNLHQPNITISFKGPVEGGSMRCFCGMTMVHHQTLSARAPCCSRPMLTRSHVSDIMAFMKSQLVEKWSLRPYGIAAVQYEDYAERYGYWKDARNPRKPRLLFLQRTKSRFIGKKEALMQVARDVGFSVHTMAFETETMERQFAAGRYADVVVGTHGAALTTLVMMDTTQALCRSLIEMFHWAPLGRIVHYQKMAYMVNVSALGLPPVDVKFGPSVRNPKKERKALKSFSYTWSGTGFHDQTSFYDVEQFRAKLIEAINHLKHCSDVDTAGMPTE